MKQSKLLRSTLRLSTFGRGPDQKKRKSRKGLYIAAGLLGGAALIGGGLLLRKKLRSRNTPLNDSFAKVPTRINKTESPDIASSSISSEPIRLETINPKTVAKTARKNRRARVAQLLRRNRSRRTPSNNSFAKVPTKVNKTESPDIASSSISSEPIHLETINPKTVAKTARESRRARVAQLLRENKYNLEDLQDEYMTLAKTKNSLIPSHMNAYARAYENIKNIKKSIRKRTNSYLQR